MTSKMARVSVGLTVYNGENYLRETLISILNQTFVDFELIISDNASTDCTQQICEEFALKDGRIKYFRNPTNLGMVPNLNRVFELSSADYFKWADHDDILEPEFIARCVEVLDNNPDIALCYPQAKLMDQDGNYLGEYDPLPKTDSTRPSIRFGNLIRYPDGRAIQSMGLIRVSLLKKTVLNRSYPSSDEVLMANLTLLGAFYEIPERLLRYRIHPRQSTKGVLASERARVLFVDTALKDKKVILIKWPYFKDCLGVIKKAPISASERLSCYYQLLRWFLITKNFKSITKDILLVIHDRIPLFPGLHREVKDTTNQVQ